jgi:hypothetical protein
MLVHIFTPRSASRENNASSSGRSEVKEKPVKTEAVEITYICGWSFFIAVHVYTQ